MSSNKTAIAVLALAVAVIGSSLWISSRTEPTAPAVSVESESNTESIAEMPDTDEDSEVEFSDVLSEVSAPESAEQEVSESTSDPEPEESFDQSSAEESSETSEPVREPLSNVVEEELSVLITVTDADGFPIIGATVYVDEEEGQTDVGGYYFVKPKDENFVLHIVADGYVSYYEELNYYKVENNTRIVLETADPIRTLLDSAELNPYTFSDDAFTEQVDTILDSLFTPGMDTYDKVLACYDWLIANTEYKRPSHTGSGYWACASVTLEKGIGTCDCYSSAFAAMMRRIGLDCYVVEGITSANRGGMTGHVWTVIEIDGKTYVFDPQVEDAIANRTSSKKVTYVRFCLTEPNGKYVYNGRSLSRQMEKFDAFLAENGSFEYTEEDE